MLTDRDRARQRALQKHDECEMQAQRLGIDALRNIIYLIPLNRKDLIELLQAHDLDLSEIPDDVWFAQHRGVQELATHAGYELWSLTKTMDVLKHVAIHYVVGQNCGRRKAIR